MAAAGGGSREATVAAALAREPRRFFAGAAVRERAHPCRWRLDKINAPSLVGRVAGWLPPQQLLPTNTLVKLASRRATPRTSPLRSPALALLAAMHHRFAGLVPTARPALPPIHGGVVGRSYPPVHRSLALRLAPFASASVRRACRPLAVSAQSTSLRSLGISLCPLHFLNFFFFVLLG